MKGLDSASSQLEQKEVVDKLDDLIDKIDAPRKKDLWDKVTIGGTFLSNVVIAIIVASLTYSFNLSQAENQNRLAEHQNRIREAEIVHKFLPQLVSKNEEEKRIALIVISNIANPDLAVRLAQQFPSKGSFKAVRDISRNPNLSTKDKKIALKALEQFTSVLERTAQQSILFGE